MLGTQLHATASHKHTTSSTSTNSSTTGTTDAMSQKERRAKIMTDNILITTTMFTVYRINDSSDGVYKNFFLLSLLLVTLFVSLSRQPRQRFLILFPRVNFLHFVDDGFSIGIASVGSMARF
jgi:hypothetical protein